MSAGAVDAGFLARLEKAVAEACSSHSGNALLKVDRKGQRGRAGVVWEAHIEPCRTGAAPLAIATDARVTIWIELGRDSRLELALTPATAALSVDRIARIVRAILLGEFVEDLWVEGDRVYRSAGKLHLDGEPVEMSHTSSWPGARYRGDHVVVQYPPYSS